MQTAMFLVVLGLSGQLEAEDRYGAGPPWSGQPPTDEGGSPLPTNNRLRSSPSSQVDDASAAPAARAPSTPPGNSSLSIQPSNPPADARSGNPYRPEASMPRRSLPPAAQETPATRDDRRVAPAAAASTQAKPSQLIERLHQAPTAGKLEGVSLSLAEAVQGSRSRREQTTRVVAYWDLSTAVADYYLALREGVEMAALQASVTRPGPEWQEALSKLEVRTQAARRSAQAAQYQMQRMLGQTGRQRLPLPSDLPHGGRYETRYESIFADRASVPAEQLSEILVLRYQELQSQAADEAAAHTWLNHVSQTRNPATGGEGLLRAYDLLSLKRRAFLFTVRDYNHKIAAYTDLATPERLAVPRLVAMHIQSTSANNAWERPDIRRASADAPPGEARTTFARP